MKNDELKSALLFFLIGAVAVGFFFIISESATGQLFRSVGNSWYLLVVGGGLIIAALARIIKALLGRSN